MRTHMDIGYMTTAATRVVGGSTLIACDDEYRQYTDYNNKCYLFFIIISFMWNSHVCSDQQIYRYSSVPLATMAIKSVVALR